jgi:ABC-type dipeptide/oligopeptide/nickel transport system ATPase subunit
MAVNFIITTRLSLPVVLVALAVVSLIGNSLWIVIWVLGFLLWDRFAVVMRSTTQQVRGLDYVAAAQATGCSTLRILLGEIMPNIANHLIVPRSRRAAAGAVLGPDGCRGQGLHVLRRLADRHPGHGAVRAGHGDQLDGRRGARRDRAGGPELSALLEVEDLSVEIPVPAGTLRPVQELSFTVDAGETLCIVGESGCGKSLTSLAIMGLLPKTARRRATRLALEGQDILDADERHMSDLRGNRMGMIFQEPMTSLNPAYTIGNQLEEALLRHRKVTRREARDRAVFLLEKVGITAATSRLRQYPHQLSGGLRQRVMIAMTLMCGPELIIADEPTSST